MRYAAYFLVAAIAVGAVFVFDAFSKDADVARADAEAAERAFTRNRAGATSLRRSEDGHYWAEALVDGVRIRFLVDTGATVVALTASDALRAGYEVDDLVFDLPVNTAGGQILAAPVTLARVSVGGIEQRAIEALVLRDGLDQSLLGMSYLGRLSRIEATPDALILRR